jgi:hypothetical protein
MLRCILKISKNISLNFFSNCVFSVKTLQQKVSYKPSNFTGFWVNSLIVVNGD